MDFHLGVQEKVKKGQGWESRGRGRLPRGSSLKTNEQTKPRGLVYCHDEDHPDCTTHLGSFS
jgi:hypothetical protein